MPEESMEVKFARLEERVKTLANNQEKMNNRLVYLAMTILTGTAAAVLKSAGIW